MKKTLSFLLAILFCLSLLPIGVLASGEPEEPGESTEAIEALPEEVAEPAQDGAEGVPVDEAHFPDPVFRQYVSDHFDTDRSGALSDAEIAKAREVELNLGEVSTFAGIGYLTELEMLNAWSDWEPASLSEIDLSHNTKLRDIALGFCDIETIDVSMMPDLETLFVGFTKLRSLDLSHNPKLYQLICSDSQLASIDLAGCAALKTLDCCGNPGLTELDISDCPLLVADYQAGGRMLPEDMTYVADYDNIRVYGYSGDDSHPYNLAVNTYTTILDGSVSGPLVLAVTSQQELTDALNKTVPVAEIHLAQDFTVTEESFILVDKEHYDNYRNAFLIVDEGVTVTVGEGGALGSHIPSFWDWPEDEEIPQEEPVIHFENNGTIVVQKGGDAAFGFEENNGTLIVKDGGEFRVPNDNAGTITVESGGALRTAQGQWAENHGSITIAEGAEMEARMGSTIVNENELALDGSLIAGCVRYGGADHMWFENTGTVSGAGVIELQDVHGMEDIENMLALAAQLRASRGIGSGIAIRYGEPNDGLLAELVSREGEQRPNDDVVIAAVTLLGEEIAISDAAALLKEEYPLAAAFVLLQLVML